MDANANAGTTNTITFNIPGAATAHDHARIVAASHYHDRSSSTGRRLRIMSIGPSSRSTATTLPSNGVTLERWEQHGQGVGHQWFYRRRNPVKGGGNVVEGNYIGIDPGGAPARSNTGAGVRHQFVQQPHRRAVRPRRGT